MLKDRKKSRYSRKHSIALYWCKTLKDMNSRKSLIRYKMSCDFMQSKRSKVRIYQTFKNTLFVIKLLRFDHLSYIKPRKLWK